MDNKILFYLNEMIRLEAGEIVQPITCEIDPSNQCQNNCSFCVSKERRDFSNMAMDFYISIIDQLTDIGIQSITFTGGGEPTCNPAFSEMAHIAKNMGFKIGLITNGIMLDSISVDIFDFIRVSLDAGTATTYMNLKDSDHFDRVIANIKKIRKSCPIVGISYVISEQGESDIRAAELLADELEVDYIQFKPDNNSNNKKTSLTGNRSIFTRRYRSTRLSCLVASLIGIVTADGRYVYCCLHRYDKGFTIGSLHDIDLRTAIKLRSNMKVDISQCTEWCRYSNYAKTYLDFKSTKYSFLRNKEFL